MKKFIKILTVTLLCVFTFVSVFACGGVVETPNEDEEQERQRTYSEGEVTYPEKLKSNGVSISNYKIVVPSAVKTKSATLYAAKRLQALIKQATPYRLPIIYDNEQEGEYEICIGETNRMPGVKVNYGILGQEGYKISAENNKLFILANDSRGALYGVYQYLEDLGYTFLTKEYTHYPYASEVFVPKDYARSYTPTFMYREIVTYPYATGDDSCDWAIANKVNGAFMRSYMKERSEYGGYEGFVGGDSYYVHNILGWLVNPGEGVAHPEYFGVNSKGKYWYEVSKGNQANMQVCMSNDAVWDIVKNAVLGKIRSTVSDTGNYPHVISVSEMDNSNHCECENCKKLYKTYGKTGAWLRRINEVADFIKEQGYGDFYINTLSYTSYTSALPYTRSESDGNYVDDDYLKYDTYTVEPRENVVIQICSSMCNYHDDPDECEELKTQQERILNWAKIAKNIYVWMYTYNIRDYFAIYPNYDEMYAHIKFFSENNVKGVYAESLLRPTCEFVELRQFLINKMMANPEMTKGEFNFWKHRFIEEYYGDASEYILEYIFETKDNMRATMKENGHVDNHIFIKDELRKPAPTWSDGFLNKCDALWNNAITAVKQADKEIKAHVEKSSLHWTYQKYCHRFEYYQDKELKENNEILSTFVLQMLLNEYNTIYPYNVAMIVVGHDYGCNPASWNITNPR